MLMMNWSIDWTPQTIWILYLTACVLAWAEFIWSRWLIKMGIHCFYCFIDLHVGTETCHTTPYVHDIYITHWSGQTHTLCLPVNVGPCWFTTNNSGTFSCISLNVHVLFWEWKWGLFLQQGVKLIDSNLHLKTRLCVIIPHMIYQCFGWICCIVKLKCYRFNRHQLLDCLMRKTLLPVLTVKCSTTFGAIVGGLSEQTFTVIGPLETPLDAPTESDVVLTFRGRDGETVLFLHGQVWVRVWVLTWVKNKDEELTGCFSSLWHFHFVKLIQTVTRKDRAKRGKPRKCL